MKSVKILPGVCNPRNGSMKTSWSFPPFVHHSSFCNLIIIIEARLRNLCLFFLVFFDLSQTGLIFRYGKVCVDYILSVIKFWHLSFDKSSRSQKFQVSCLFFPKLLTFILELLDGRCHCTWASKFLSGNMYANTLLIWFLLRRKRKHIQLLRKVIWLVLTVRQSWE